MTKENAIKAYKYALEQGNQKWADDILRRYPEFKEKKKEEIQEEKPKSKRKK